jgi:hypothetical protein
MEMICLNETTSDPNAEPISSPISCSPLSSSPVKSQTIKDLLESPIINRSQNSYSDEEIIVAESPEHQLINGINDNEDEECVKEIPMTQEFDSLDSSSETSVDRLSRNSLKRQTSICVNNMTSSPRALAILKNAIKTTINSNINCDNNNDNNNEIICETNGFSNKSSNNYFNTSGIYSPPSHKMLKNSPFSRGSALLRAAKERMSKGCGTPPKTLSNSVNVDLDDDSIFRDKQLTGILRKHELQSSPTNSEEPKPKKKKVLFAEPVVTSEREFECSQFFSRSVKSIQNVFKTIDNEFDLMNDRKRNNLVHQNSTFHDNETPLHDIDHQIDSQENACDSNDSNSPLLMSQYDKESIDPICYEEPNLDDNCLANNELNSVDLPINEELEPDFNDSGIPLITVFILIFIFINLNLLLLLCFCKWDNRKKRLCRHPIHIPIVHSLCPTTLLIMKIPKIVKQIQTKTLLSTFRCVSV